MDKKRRVAPPCLFSQRNNPYCELLSNYVAKINDKNLITKYFNKKMKNIIGLDLGTNSIGWAKISVDEDGKFSPQIALGSRIIPMSQDVLGKFDSGVTESQTAVRTDYRSHRRLRERSLLRRERLHRVLHILKFLPDHYDKALGWDKNDNKTYCKFIDDSEPKIAWKRSENGKMEFIFMDSFNEMLSDFAKNQPDVVANNKKIPLDWTLFYLRDKALTSKISKQELAWIILNFNQKRGYYQLRGEDEDENSTKLEEYYVLKVVNVADTGEKRKDDTWYNVHLENGWIYKRASKIPLDNWIGKEREFIVTTELEKDGSIKLDKEGNPRRSFRAPNSDDWKLQKKRAEATISKSEMTVGSYIYRNLLTNPYDKIRGKLVRTIERTFYKEELERILNKQKEFHSEFTDKALFEACCVELYAKNISHRESLLQHDLTHLLINDILFYHRPLKSKKSLISNCPFESYQYVDKETGEIKIQHIKAIAKSNPYFQEMRVWQFIQNLRLYDTTSINEDDVTDKYFPNDDAYVNLFKFLNDKDKISQEAILNQLGIKKPKGKDSKYPVRWNYVEDKSYPCNETRYEINKALKKANVELKQLQSLIDDKEEKDGTYDKVMYRLWHLLYSLDDRNELINALNHLAEQNNLTDSFVEAFKKIKPFKKEYGAFSEKATKKLLSVMRMGDLWDESLIDETTKERMHQIVEGKIEDESISKMHRTFTSIEGFKGLPVWLASYVVYGKHSEASDIREMKKPEDLKCFIREFKQYSMRNPIVEQCVLETLRTVYDLWVKYGHIDEIHIELGRSMKSTAEQRAKASQRMLNNENTNQRIKLLLLELKNDKDIEDVRPYSPMQQDILRIYEEGALHELNKEDNDYDEIKKISQLAQPTQKELLKYKLWLEQKYRSPYTGRTISLSKLFTPAYQIEHVIPQSRFFDDSFNNKVICEAEVNQRKSDKLGYEFIKECGGEIVHCPSIGDVTIFKEAEYKKFVADHYSNNKDKAKRLMLEDIPEEFIQRQMNDSRYISKVIKGILSNIVREDGEVDAISKNVIPCSGGITDRLKKDWGLNDVWNTLMTPRFERMNSLTNSEEFGHWENKEGKRVFQTSMPLELQRGFSKKRIDHRHHAMDALVIALASRNIINYLNNESARDTKRREDLRQLLCDKNRIIRKPWDTFTQDAKNALDNIVVSFKHYVRVINKASNYYEHYNEFGKKEMIAQKNNEQWAIRKPLHKETVFGKVNLRRTKSIAFSKAIEQPDNIENRALKCQIKKMLKEGKDIKQINTFFKNKDYFFNGESVAKTNVFFFSNDDIPEVATRKPLDDTFDEKRIMSISDTGIQKILLNYLSAKGGDPKVAFTPEGIVEMNQNIREYNNGKNHLPILKVRICEVQGEKFAIGANGINSKKFVEAQKGTNLYFAIYEDCNGKRTYSAIPLNIVVERLKMNMSPVPEEYEGSPLKFYLSPNDSVYVPTEDEKQSANINLDKNRIYKFVSATGNYGFFVPNSFATVIANKVELLSLNKMEKSLDGIMIKANCWKLEVDRLGNITKVIR